MRGYIEKKDLKGFDITKYDDSKNMTIADWANAISFRYMVYRTYSQFDKKIDYKNLMNQIFEKPINISNSSKPHAYGVLGSNKSIYDVTVMDVYYYFTERINHPSMVDVKNECEKRDKLFELNDDVEILSNDKKLNWKLLDSSFMSYSNEKTGYNDSDELLRVNMSFSDDLIINDLKRWLKEKRLNSDKFKKSFQKSDLENWSKLRVLALLDLDFYSEIYSVRFTNHLLGDLLFPDDEVDVAEKIRKTVRPLANNLFQNDMINLLSNQANSEVVEK